MAIEVTPRAREWLRNKGGVATVRLSPRLASVLEGGLWPLLGGLLYATFTQILWSA